MAPFKMAECCCHDDAVLLERVYRPVSSCVVQTATCLDALYYSNTIFICILAIILMDLRNKLLDG